MNGVRPEIAVLATPAKTAVVNHPAPMNALPKKKNARAAPATEPAENTILILATNGRR
jgi:hypothetical protein